MEIAHTDSPSAEYASTTVPRESTYVTELKDELAAYSMEHYYSLKELPTNYGYLGFWILSRYFLKTEVSL